MYDHFSGNGLKGNKNMGLYVHVNLNTMKAILVTLSWLLLTPSLVEGGPPEEITVGLLHPGFSKAFKLNNIKAGIVKVFEDINNRTDILNNTKFNFILGDSFCDITYAIGAAVDLYNAKVKAFIGPACSRGCVITGLLSTNKHIPMVSYSCSSLELSNKDDYPFFARTKPFARTGPWSPRTFIAINQMLKWRHVCLIERVHEIYTLITEKTREEFLAQNYTVYRERYYSEDTTYEQMGIVLKRLEDRCRGRYFRITNVSYH